MIYLLSKTIHHPIEISQHNYYVITILGGIFPLVARILLFKFESNFL